MNRRTRQARVREPRRTTTAEKIEETAAEIEARISRTAARYTQAFPEVDAKSLAAHLELVITGSAVASGLVHHIAREGFDITRPRFTVLRILYLTPEHRMLQNEIAQEMAVTSANVTQIIDMLEADGWVERIVSPQDRRFVYAQLTSSGVEACDRLVPAMVEFMARTSEALSADETAQLISLLGRIRSSLETMYEDEA